MNWLFLWMVKRLVILLSLREMRKHMQSATAESELPKVLLAGPALLLYVAKGTAAMPGKLAAQESLRKAGAPLLLLWRWGRCYMSSEGRLPSSPQTLPGGRCMRVTKQPGIQQPWITRVTVVPRPAAGFRQGAPRASLQRSQRA